jgi:3-methyl-2-oxobutanoate hydroxymethyltransferase
MEAVTGRLSVETLQKKKHEHKKISMLTAYDFNSALICDTNGIDAVLVGDSLGQIVHGRGDALSVTVTEMVYHTRIVARGVRRSMLIADMPYRSYDDPDSALKNAGRLIEEGGADAVMIQGRAQGKNIETLTAKGIPVLACIGMNPAHIAELGPFSAKSVPFKKEYEDLIRVALYLERAGCFAIVLRTLPANLARFITAQLKIPTIGFGSGRHVDGQFLLFHDLLGVTDDFRPRHVKRYAHLSQVMLQGVRSFISDVSKGIYPDEDYEY